MLSILHQLNPVARQVVSERGRVELSEVLNTGLFDLEEAQSSAGWVRELNNLHVPETEEYGIASFVYRARRPFHPGRFGRLVDEGFTGLLRAKGFFWLATRHDYLLLFSIAGITVAMEPQAKWLAAGTDAVMDEETRAYRASVWETPFDDRRQEIVFIGAGMDRAALERRLHRALLTPEEMRDGPERWVRYEDPFAELFRDREQAEAEEKEEVLV